MVFHLHVVPHGIKLGLTQECYSENMLQLTTTPLNMVVSVTNYFGVLSGDVNVLQCPNNQFDFRW